MRSSRSGTDPLDPGPKGFAHRGLHYGSGIPENSLIEPEIFNRLLSATPVTFVVLGLIPLVNLIVAPLMQSNLNQVWEAGGRP